VILDQAPLLASADKAARLRNASVSFLPLRLKTEWCYSACDSDQSQAILGWVHKVSSRTWDQIYASAGATGNRTGLGWEPWPKGHPKVPEAPKDKPLASMRVTKRFRAWGYREEDVFLTIAFDPKHKI